MRIFLHKDLSFLLHDCKSQLIISTFYPDNLHKKIHGTNVHAHQSSTFQWPDDEYR